MYISKTCLRKRRDSQTCCKFISLPDAWCRKKLTHNNVMIFFYISHIEPIQIYLKSLEVISSESTVL